MVDEEQSILTNTIIGAVANSPNVEIRAVTGNFAEAENMLRSQQADGILLLPSNLSNSIRRGETGGIGLYLSAANFLKTQKIGLGLASSMENALGEYAEKFQNISDFSPALSIHKIPLFNPLSGYGSYIFPAVAPLIIHQTILLGSVHADCDLSTKHHMASKLYTISWHFLVYFDHWNFRVLLFIWFYLLAE